MERGALPASDFAAATFDLDRVELTDGTITVSGWWRGVRGRRFIRPSLTPLDGGGGARVLADLERKPWSAEDGELWVAEFPWSGPLAADAAFELSVAPDLTVRIPPVSSSRSEPLRAPEAERVPEAESAPVAERVPEAEGASEAEADLAPDPPSPTREDAEASRRRDEALRARDEAVRDRDSARAERDAALDERENALARLHEAVQARRQAENERDALADARDSLLRECERLAEREAAGAAEIERLERELELARVRSEAEAEALRTQLAVANEKLIATDRDLTGARRELATAEKQLVAARAERASAPASLVTETRPPLQPRPLPSRPQLAWDGSRYARPAAFAAVFLVALVMLLILLLR